MSADGSVVLTDGNEELYRQVHPSHVTPDGVISKEAFIPSARDKDLLSTLRQRIGPAEAYRRWTEDQRYLSAGTFAITVHEVTMSGLRAIDDEATTQPDHASVDFSSLATRGMKMKTARKLRDAAIERGCRYSP